MSDLLKRLSHPITSSRFDILAGQLASWGVALLVLVLGCMKLAKLPLSETELLFGLLLVLIVAMLCILIGFVLPLSQRGGPSD